MCNMVHPVLVKIPATCTKFPEQERTLPFIPWGCPSLTGRGDERIPLRATSWRGGVEEVSNPCVELTLDGIGREFGEHGGMSDCIDDGMLEICPDRWP